MIKDENKNHFKTAIKAKKCFNKNVERFVGKKRNETNVFQLCCGKKGKITLVTLVWLEKPWKLRWNGCRVANKQTNLNDQELLRDNVLNEFSIANVLEIKLKCLKNGFAKNTLKTVNQIAMLNFPTD